MADDIEEKGISPPKKTRLLTGSPPPYTKPLITQLIERDGYNCKLCGCFVEQDDRSKDHINPLKEHGSDDLGNLQLTHRVCNSNKAHFIDKDELIYHLFGRLYKQSLRVEAQTKELNRRQRAPSLIFEYERKLSSLASLLDNAGVAYAKELGTKLSKSGRQRFKKAYLDRRQKEIIEEMQKLFT